MKQLLNLQREFFSSGATINYQFRLAMLDKLYAAIAANEHKLFEALFIDLHKPKKEAFVSEIGYLYHEISVVRKKLFKLMRPKKVRNRLTTIGAGSAIYHQPYGQVLILSPWNYPVQLIFSPLLGAIAAGNTAIIKPSELTPHCGEVAAEIIRENFPSEYITTVIGDAEVAKQLLEQKFDFIFFTGSPAIGRKVMAAAARNLTPLVLELGGKSPVIVDRSANLSLTARRLAFGKFFNAGQTCIAPDYLLAHREIVDHLLPLLKKEIELRYSSADNSSHIVNKQHFERLLNYLKEGTIYCGGQYQGQWLAPTIVTDLKDGDSLLRDEIFGPILPVVVYSEFNELKSIIDKNPNPLSLYLFAGDKKLWQQVLRRISFGNGCLNDTLVQITNKNLPFGGVGSSGIGRYGGAGSFFTFSNSRGIVRQNTLIDWKQRYPGGNDQKNLNLFRKIFK